MTKTKDVEELVTRSEAARLLGVHYNTIRHRQARGELSTVRRLGRLGVEEALVPREEIDRDLAKAEEAGKGVVRVDNVETLKALELAQREIARLGAENDALRTALEEAKAEKDRLLGEILDIARGK